MPFAIQGFARVVAAVSLLVLSACGSTFKVGYDAPIATSQSANWRVADVRVVVPESLKVSEDKTIFPRADIVWREDPVGDRRPQVAKVIRDATMQAAAPLRGSRPVRIDITVARFHALTFEAESRLTVTGVYNVKYTAQVVDIASGQVLAGPTAIEADRAAMVGSEATRLRRQGVTQRSLITETVRNAMAGWLGVGPDPRGTFNRIGG